MIRVSVGMDSKLRTAGIIIASVAFAVSIYLLVAAYVSPDYAVSAETSSWLSPTVLGLGLVGILLFNLGSRQKKLTA
jgi:hypothetical protein